MRTCPKQAGFGRRWHCADRLGGQHTPKAGRTVLGQRASAPRTLAGYSFPVFLLFGILQGLFAASSSTARAVTDFLVQSLPPPSPPARNSQAAEARPCSWTRRRHFIYPAEPELKGKHLVRAETRRQPELRCLASRS